MGIAEKPPLHPNPRLGNSCSALQGAYALGKQLEGGEQQAGDGDVAQQHAVDRVG